MSMHDISHLDLSVVCFIVYGTSIDCDKCFVV